MDLIYWAIFVGVLSYEMVYSDLAWKLKEFLMLDKYYPQFELLSSHKSYFKLFGNLTYLLFPIVLIVMIICLLHRFIYKLLECAYCTSIHVGWITGLLLSFHLPEAVLLGFMGSFITAIYSKLRG